MKIVACPDVFIYESPKLLKEWLKFNRREAYGSKIKSNHTSQNETNKVKNLIDEIRANHMEIFSSDYSIPFKFRAAFLFLFLRLHAYTAILIAKFSKDKRIR